MDTKEIVCVRMGIHKSREESAGWRISIRVCVYSIPYLGGKYTLYIA